MSRGKGSTVKPADSTGTLAAARDKRCFLATPPHKYRRGSVHRHKHLLVAKEATERISVLYIQWRSCGAVAPLVQGQVCSAALPVPPELAASFQ